jgi:hypothetical protein
MRQLKAEAFRKNTGKGAKTFAVIEADQSTKNGRKFFEGHSI